MTPMDGVHRSTLEGLVADYERALRAVCGEAGLPAEWDARLKGIDRSSATGLLKYWKWLAIYSELYHERRHRGATSEEAEAAARQLLTREPVEVTLQSGRRVRVTGRSYAAMMEIARHERRIRALGADLQRLDRQMDALSVEIEQVDAGRLPALRRRLRAYLRLADRVQDEMTRQRYMLWTHALTPTGAPATDPEAGPKWWAEVTPADDAALILALWEAGAGRYTKLGAPPEGRGSKGEREDWGWASLFASVERQHKIAPASLYDQDLFRLLTWVRGGADPVPEELGG